MPPVLETFRDILLLRRGPQDLPYSPRMLIGLCVACLMLQALAGTIPTAANFGDLLLSGMVELALMFAVLRIALHARGLGNRLVQTMSAIVGCNLIFTAASLPLLLMFGELPLESGRIVAEKITSAQFTTMLALAVLGFWQLRVNIHILRQSLNLTLLWALAAIFGWYGLLSLALSLVSGPQS
jgi:hypothetical protein